MGMSHSRALLDRFRGIDLRWHNHPFMYCLCFVKRGNFANDLLLLLLFLLSLVYLFVLLFLLVFV